MSLGATMSRSLKRGDTMGHVSRRSTRRTAAYNRTCFMFALLVLISLLTACDSGTVSARAMPTMDMRATSAAQATQAAEPVSVSMGLSQPGTVAADAYKLDVTVTVTNHTGNIVYLVHSACLTGLGLLRRTCAAGRA
jgi:hypothetical protein